MLRYPIPNAPDCLARQIYADLLSDLRPQLFWKPASATAAPSSPAPAHSSSNVTNRQPEACLPLPSRKGRCAADLGNPTTGNPS